MLRGGGGPATANVWHQTELVYGGQLARMKYRLMQAGDLCLWKGASLGLERSPGREDERLCVLLRSFSSHKQSGAICTVYIIIVLCK